MKLRCSGLDLSEAVLKVSKALAQKTTSPILEGIKLSAEGVERGRKTNPKLKVGVCGEHGGDPASVGFFYKAGFTYVSCSPFRVPVARLAAAQAALK